MIHFKFNVNRTIFKVTIFIELINKILYVMLKHKLTSPLFLPKEAEWKTNKKLIIIQWDVKTKTTDPKTNCL